MLQAIRESQIENASPAGSASLRLVGSDKPPVSAKHTVPAIRDRREAGHAIRDAARSLLEVAQASLDRDGIGALRGTAYKACQRLLESDDPKVFQRGLRCFIALEDRSQERRNLVMDFTISGLASFAKLYVEQLRRGKA